MLTSVVYANNWGAAILEKLHKRVEINYTVNLPRRSIPTCAPKRRTLVQQEYYTPWLYPAYSNIGCDVWGLGVGVWDEVLGIGEFDKLISHLFLDGFGSSRAGFLAFSTLFSDALVTVLQLASSFTGHSTFSVEWLISPYLIHFSTDFVRPGLEF